MAGPHGQTAGAEVVIDPVLVNNVFAQDGGAKQLDEMLAGELAHVIQNLAAHVWPGQT